MNLPLVRPKQPPASRSKLVTTLKPHQVKPKRGQETFIKPPVEQKEVPSSNPKQIKCMKKKLGKLNKKISHSKRKHNNLVSMQNSIKKKTEDLKRQQEPEESREPEESFNPVELEKAFDRLVGVIELMEEVEWI